MKEQVKQRPIVFRKTPKRRLVSVVFIDIVGSTELAVKDESKAIDLYIQYQDMMRKSVEAHSGKIAKSVGDGVIAVFVSPRYALQFALAHLPKVQQFNESHETFVQIRTTIGICTGDIVEIGSDLVGTTVNLAARLSRAAEPGEIILDEATVMLMGKEIGRKLRRRPKTMRGIDHELTVYTLRPMKSKAA